MTTDPLPSDMADGALDAPNSRVRTKVGDRSLLSRSYATLALLTLVVSAAFFAFRALPFMDLPAHAGVLALRDRIATSAIDQSYFVVAPHLGSYSLFRGLGHALLLVTSPVGAMRVLGTLPVLAMPAAVLFARRRLHGDVSVAPGYAALALSLGLMTLFGFASFMLAIAVVIVATTLWLEILDSADAGKPVLRLPVLGFAALAVFVFLSHGFAFLVFCGVSGISCLVTGKRLRRLVHLVAFVPALAVAGRAAILDRGVPAGTVATDASMPLNFQSPLDKLSLLVTPTLLSRWGIDIVGGVALIALIVVATVMTARRAGTEPRVRALLANAMLLGLLFVVLPHEVGWFGFIDARLVPLALLFLVVAVRTDTLSTRVRRAWETVPAVVAAIVGGVLWLASAAFQNEAAGYEQVFAEVPDGARLLNLPIDPDSDVFTGHPFVHYDKLIMVDRPLVPSDVWFHQGSAIFPTAKNPATHLPRDYRSSSVRALEWNRYVLDEWDYVLVRMRPNAHAPEPPSSLSLVIHRGGWWLYRRTAP